MEERERAEISNAKIRYVTWLSFFPDRLHRAQPDCLLEKPGCSQACPLVHLTVVQLNLKPEAPLSALLLTNNEIQRDSWKDVSTIELRDVLSTARIRKYSFPRLEVHELKRHVQLYKPQRRLESRHFLRYLKIIEKWTDVR